MPTRSTRSTTPPDLLAAIAAEDWPRALRIAAKFRHLGEAKADVTRAWAARQNPDFYRSLGHDVDALILAGAAALRARFLDHPDTPKDPS